MLAKALLVLPALVAGQSSATALFPNDFMNPFFPSRPGRGHLELQKER